MREDMAKNWITDVEKRLNFITVNREEKEEYIFLMDKREEAWKTNWKFLIL